MEISIEQEEEGKGRTFSGTVLSYISSDSHWESGGSDRLRPSFLVVATTEAQIRPLVANLRMGKKATISGDNHTHRDGKLEILKTSKMSVFYQRVSNAATATFVAPEIYDSNPGMVDPSGIKFILFPRRSLVQEIPWNRNRAKAILLSLTKRTEIPEWFLPLIDLAPLFAVYLDSRTRCPLINDPAFFLVLMYSCIQGGLAGTWAKSRYRVKNGEISSVYGYAHPQMDLSPPLAFKSDHAAFEAVLAPIAQWFMQNVDQI
jgi:hypothetical protein